MEKELGYSAWKLKRQNQLKEEYFTFSTSWVELSTGSLQTVPFDQVLSTRVVIFTPSLLVLPVHHLDTAVVILHCFVDPLTRLTQILTKMILSSK